MPGTVLGALCTFPRVLGQASRTRDRLHHQNAESNSIFYSLNSLSTRLRNSGLVLVFSDKALFSIKFPII